MTENIVYSRGYNLVVRSRNTVKSKLLDSDVLEGYHDSVTLELDANSP